MKYMLLQSRFEHPAGTIAYTCSYNSFGLISDDENETGEPHLFLTLNEDGDYPGFTIPSSHVRIMKPDGAKSLITFIELPNPGCVHVVLPDGTIRHNVGSDNMSDEDRRDMDKQFMDFFDSPEGEEYYSKLATEYPKE